MSKKPIFEVFAIHLDGKLLDPKEWKKELDKIGKYSKGFRGDRKYYRSPFTRTPKKVYTKKWHASNAINQLPKEIQHRCEIVKYVPEESNDKEEKQ